jgi:carboxymethylenebutenolidase
MNVVDEIQDLTTPTGPMRTYFYRPHVAERSNRWPGLVLYSEIFQQTPPVRRLAIQFASQGYVVGVPEVYHSHEGPGVVLGYDEAGKDRGNALKQLTPMTTFDTDARIVLDALLSNPHCNGRLGAVGICLGGHLAFRAALQPDVRATACFYGTDLHSGTLGAGGNANSLHRAAEVKGELLLVWGRQDPHIPFEGRVAIQRALHDAGVWFTWHEFNGAHAFLRDEGPRYDPSLARLCLQLAFDLFQRNL